MESIYLDTQGVLDRIASAVQAGQPFSLVRIGDGENLVLAQETVLTIDQVLQERWAAKANRGQKGLNLPNLVLRDLVASSVRQADIVGILPYDDASIKAPDYLKRQMTDRTFRQLGIAPAVTCHACVNRELAVMPQFWELLRSRRILIATRETDKLAARLAEEPYGVNVVHAVPFGHSDQLAETLSWIGQHKDEFDVALFTCGVNAVVLAERTAAITGKVAIDFGKAASILLIGRPN